MATGSIFNIQRFSTHDGPGIRTTVFFKGCPLRCFWCQNPESQLPGPQLMFNDSLCTGCGRCVSACEYGAVSVENGVAVIDRRLCRACGRCAAACLNDGRKLSGREASVQEIMGIIRKDMAMFENSGGGVTLSGGEPTMQPEFAAELLDRCADLGIHTALETCGFAPWEHIARLVPMLKLVFFDIKAVDDGKHARGTGVSNVRILENAQRLAATGVSICVRMPLIPGFNDTAADVRLLGRFVRERMGLSYENIELLAYNNLGESKFDKFGRPGERPSLKTQSEDYLESLRTALGECFR